MRLKKSKRAAATLSCLLCTFAATAVADESAEFKAAYRAGRADAQRDIARNYLAVEESGRGAAWTEDYVNLALRQFGIHVKRVAGCLVDDTILGHAQGYNEISMPEIKRRFGRDVLVEAQIAASEKWEKSRQK